jgi:tRNA modification GTPase
MVNQKNNDGRPDEVVCGALTAAGRGAIAVVEVRGVGAARMIEGVFAPFSRRRFQDTLHRKLIYGTWCPTGEDVVVCRVAESHFEVHCHGGTAAVESIISALTESGASEISATEASNARGLDLWRAEIWNALPKATTERTAAFALRQLDRLPAEIGRVLKNLSDGDAKKALDRIDLILSWSHFGVSLLQVPSVVLCGQPNVGKSSLINSIVGFQRAIVHSSAGTTRDVVSQRTAVDGWPVELSDTAGLRQAEGPVEEIGVENARKTIDAARVLIGVFDGSRPWNVADQRLFDRLDCDIVVHNKSDHDAFSADGVGDALARPPGHATSATQNEGIEQLITLIAGKLVPELPPDDSVWCINEDAVERLKLARERLKEGGRSCEDRCAEAERILKGVVDFKVNDGP